MYGDTAAGRKRAGQLREQGEDIRAMAERLVAQAEAVPWSGRAAESMRNRIKERAAHLRSAAGHHDTAADSLTRHLTEVDTLKDAIDTIEHKTSGLVADAQNRISQNRISQNRVDQDTYAEETVSPEDDTLTHFSPPPPGHKDWLHVELPGL